ncbi:hypothetical protein AWM79_14835 [Pseudomonas agarici]|uniref:Uncharacterized protein n=1 Tax=Pseudomonas agarici TaxID=46677 RepID=A0A0X1T3R5_PSEAA|nr:hypothetical protein [Pseudomonas agarici]AMB86509.1 hypothetical protein AWM79_14835 [Pseudomonas agarici]NWB93682.1 hypothetical protein [Pseudomonas agarici]NWC11096.1 hypothetical protein [Pseudomonas agarici]
MAIDDDAVTPSVCADFSHARDVQHAAQSGANLYAAGLLIASGGYVPDSTLLEGYAGEHARAVLMANHGGAVGGWQSTGRIVIWTQRG